jgi:hypothetical protein
MTRCSPRRRQLPPHPRHPMALLLALRQKHPKPRRRPNSSPRALSWRQNRNHRNKSKRRLRAKKKALSIARRSCIAAIGGVFATAMIPRRTNAKTNTLDQWIAAFRSKAVAHGITDDTCTNVMAGIRPDAVGLEAIRNRRAALAQASPARNRRQLAETATTAGWAAQPRRWFRISSIRPELRQQTIAPPWGF